MDRASLIHSYCSESKLTTAAIQFKGASYELFIAFNQVGTFPVAYYFEIKVKHYGDI